MEQRRATVDDALELPPVVVVPEGEAALGREVEGGADELGTASDRVEVGERIGTEEREHDGVAAELGVLVERRRELALARPEHVGARDPEAGAGRGVADLVGRAAVEARDLHADISHRADLLEHRRERLGRLLAHRVELDGDRRWRAAHRPPHRVALLDERFRRLAHVARERPEHLRPVLELDGMAEAGGVEVGPEAELGHVHAELAVLHDERGELDGGVEELVLRDDAVEEPDPRCLLGAESPAREHELRRHRGSDEPRQEVARSHVARREPDADELRREERVVARDAQITGKREREAATHRRTVHSRDHGLRELVDGEDERGEVLLDHLHEADGTSLLGTCGQRVAREVRARAEATAGSRQDHDSCAAIRTQLLDGGPQLLDHRDAQRVVPRRVVELDDADPGPRRADADEGHGRGQAGRVSGRRTSGIRRSVFAW